MTTMLPPATLATLRPLRVPPPAPLPREERATTPAPAMTMKEAA